MSSTFELTLNPAADGDCLRLTWGRSGGPLRHILIDLGREAAWRAVRDEVAALDHIELFVMSHVDADHIAGAIPMIREATPPFAPKRVWYNARPQLVAAKDRQPIVEPFGARQGEKLARGIVHFNWPWNAEFASEVVSTDSPEGGDWIEFPDGLRLRLLSPNDEALVALLPVWDRELAAAHLRTFDPDSGDDPLGEQFESFGVPNVKKLAAADYTPDTSEPNGSSIAFLAEFEGKRVLLAADAHSEILEAALKPLAEAEGGRYRLDLLKVAHHGSKYNTSKRLPELIDCTRFAFSADGSRHNHPDAETVARFLAADKDRMKTLYFNYRQPQTECWKSQALTGTWNYGCEFPSGANGTIVIPI